MSQTTRQRRTARMFLGTASAIALMGPLLVGTAPAHAVAAPGGLTVSPPGSSTPILSWNRVGRATGYQVQVDNDPGFASPEFNVNTANFRAVPTTALKAGTNHWRVRSTQSGTSSGWTSGNPFDVAPVNVPIPVSPANGARLAQPQDAPLLEWQGSPNAQSYTVEVDGDADFVGAKTYTTKSTSLVVPDPLGVGDWFWRVSAVKGSGLVSLPSSTMTFDVLALQQPRLVSPADSVDTKIGDVVVDWEPVPGARSYDVQISDGPDFNPNTTTQALGVVGTSYSPRVTLNNDQFWWRVRAVDLNGLATPWSETRFGFERAWTDQPRPVYPLGSISAPSTITQARPHYEWTPVPKASQYELVIASDANFSVGISTCYVAGTTYAPRSASDCGYRTGGTTYWKVRPIDKPYDTYGLAGQRFSPTQAFTWTGSPAAQPFAGFAPVEGMKVSVNASGAGCSDDLCTGLPSTPVLSWDPQPGVTRYQVFIGQDKAFTTSVLAPRSAVITTTNTMLTLEAAGRSVGGDLLSSLPDSSAGQAYHWHVRPCTASACGPDPRSPDVPVRTKSFVKVSPAVTGLTSSDPTGTEITFKWDEYFTSNQATSWNGERGNQSARGYQIEVDSEPSFQAPLLDRETVDQTTFTSPTALYPEGTIYWRVQAIDDANNYLTWSVPQSLVKQSPTISLSSPANGAAIPGTLPFRWNAQAFAASYTLEVYKNEDYSFSPANQLFSTTVKTPAYAWSQPIPADPRAYLWRVRRTDAKGNPGPWSAPYAFRSLGAAPALTGPANNSWQPAAGPLLTWTDVPGAATYTVRLDKAGTMVASTTTAANAYAPTSVLGTGGYTWTVTALDSGGKPLGTSPAGSFRIDAIAPRILSAKPFGSAKPKNNLVVKFSERVRGVSGKTVKLYQKGKKKPLKAKVKMNKRGTKVVINPKKNLKKGKTYIVKWKHKRIKDVAGNRLVKPQKWTFIVL